MKKNPILFNLVLIFTLLIAHSPVNAQTISSINPDNGQIGQLLTIQISGSNVDFTTGSSSIQTNFKQGSTTIFAPPITVDASGTILDVSLNLSNTSLPSGLYDLEVTTQTNGLITLPNAFRIDTTALISTTPQIAFKGQAINVTIAGRALNFNNVTAAPYYFRNNDTIWTTIVQPRTGPNTNLEVTVDLTPTTVRAGNYDLQVMTPGGPLYLRNALEVKTTNISGTVFYDVNQNGIMDSGEIGVSSPLKLLPSNDYAYSSSYTGSYSFNNIAAGTYDVIIEPPFWATTTTPDTQRIVVSSLNTFTATPFGINSSGNAIDINISATRARCNGSMRYRMDLQNYGPTAINGVFYFVKNTLLTYQTTTINQADSVQGDTIYYSFNNLQTLQEQQEDIFCDLPGVPLLNVGSTIEGNGFVYQTNSTGTIIPGSDTSDTYFSTVFCSYDPNDKQVNPIGIDSGGFVAHDTPLEYTIRFQNTGNDTAYRVVVLDTLSSDLDLSTFRLINTSHPVITELNSGGELSFVFDNIFLVDSATNEPASNGSVSFGISPNRGLLDSTAIRNKAAIYFDFNPPIITNEVINTFANLITSIETNKLVLEANISPNPSKGNFNVKLKENLSDAVLRVYDLNGREVYLNRYNNTNAINLNLNSLSNGIYLLSIIDGNKAYTEKLIIEN